MCSNCFQQYNSAPKFFHFYPKVNCLILGINYANGHIHHAQKMGGRDSHPEHLKIGIFSDRHVQGFFEETLSNGWDDVAEPPLFTALIAKVSSATVNSLKLQGLVPMA